MKIVQLILASSISMLIINNINAKYKLFKRMQSKINSTKIGIHQPNTLLLHVRLANPRRRLIHTS